MQQTTEAVTTNTPSQKLTFFCRLNLYYFSRPIEAEGDKTHITKFKTKRSSKNQMLHFLDIAELLSSNAWLKWAKRQEKPAENTLKTIPNTVLANIYKKIG